MAVMRGEGSQKNIAILHPKQHYNAQGQAELSQTNDKSLYISEDCTASGKLNKPNS